ncbi:X-linked interleukin-1 receptor accessory protein-like 2 [Panulirus ornatus]|uniref:X-linked interleukin-1 receptor accessory protein-like 2 n=1 Tax=Panulirus ornatus TaxID=150431 RepID=UPI003A87616E
MVRRDVSTLLLLQLYLLLLVLLVVPSADSRDQGRSNSKHLCPCELEFQSKGKRAFPADSIKITKSGKINCCVVRFLGYRDPNATVVWKFKGVEYPWPQKVNTFEKHFCGMETLETRSASQEDQGEYTCTVISSNGTSVTKTMSLTVFPNVDYREKPSLLKVSGHSYALVGRNASFFCKAFVGLSPDLPPSISWRKLLPNGNPETFANRLPKVTTTVSITNGHISGQLVFNEVEKAHFGNYCCLIQNIYGVTQGNFALIEGLTPSEKWMENLKIIVVAEVVILVVLLLALYVWCRCGLLLRLYYSHSIVGGSVKEGFQQDVFVVHGDSASCWVWTVLLPMLEDTCGYTCFLPQRDMCGGEQVAESILAAISRCRRVLVVVTPCLLESAWASWAMCSGIHAVLTSQARMLALVLERETLHGTSQQGEDLLGILKVVKQIPVPAVCGLQLVQAQEDYMLVSAAVRLEKETQPSELKLDIPKIKIDNALSNSPKSQRLSNMISGSNTASRENLEADNKKTEAGGPIIFTEEDFGQQDPGSPCSFTPFIMPSCQRTRDAGAQVSAWQSLCRCIRLVFGGDIEQVFWQTVRYRLGPPSLRSQGRRPTIMA